MALPENSASPRLLKADSVRGLGSKVIFNFTDLRKQGDSYLESVRRQAHDLVEHAQQDAAQIRQQALEKSIEDGRKEGLRQAEQTIDQQAQALAQSLAQQALSTAIPAMKSAAEAIGIERDRWLAEWEGTAVRLAVAIAGRLMRRTINIEPDRAKEMIRTALQLAAGTPQITLRLHPDDAAALGNQAQELARALAVCGEAHIHPDTTLERGDCVIDTQHGTIDARIETLLDRIVAELIGEHASQS